MQFQEQIFGEELPLKGVPPSVFYKYRGKRRMSKLYAFRKTDETQRRLDAIERRRKQHRRKVT
jgi:hypothetical protein